MRPLTHNGFVLKYDGFIFPVSRSNEITKDCYYLMGGLSNDRLCKFSGYGYETYHRLDKM